MISETKLDESFPPGQFLLDSYSAPFHSDRDDEMMVAFYYLSERTYHRNFYQ